MNKKITSLLTVAVMTGMLSAQGASADNHEGHGHDAKDKAHNNGCKGKDGCKGEHKKAKAAKGKKAAPAPTDAKTSPAPSEEAPH